MTCQHGPEDLRVRANGVKECAACKKQRSRRNRRRHRDDHPRLPLVLSATRLAVRQASSLGVEGALENAVAAAIASGRLTGRRVLSRERGTNGEARYAFIGDDLRVEVRSTRAPSGRKAWVPMRVERVPEDA